MDSLQDICLHTSYNIKHPLTNHTISLKQDIVAARVLKEVAHLEPTWPGPNYDVVPVLVYCLYAPHQGDQKHQHPGCHGYVMDTACEQTERTEYMCYLVVEHQLVIQV